MKELLQQLDFDTAYKIESITKIDEEVIYSHSVSIPFWASVSRESGRGGGKLCYSKQYFIISKSELKDKIKRWSIEQGYDIDEQPYGSQVVNLQTGDIEYGSLEKDRPKMKEEKSWYKPEHVFACGRYVLDKIRGNKKLEENK